MKPIYSLLTLLLISLSVSIQAQVTISGKIVDSTSREPLAGASVFAQNTTQGTVTNSSGEFSITLKSGGYELIFSFTGYLTQQIQITENKSQQLEVAMVKEDKTLGEVGEERHCENKADRTAGKKSNPLDLISENVFHYCRNRKCHPADNYSGEKSEVAERKLFHVVKIV